MVYSGGDVGDNNNSIRGGSVGKDCSWAKKTNSVLDLASDSYSKLEIFIGASKPFSSTTWHYLLTTYLTSLLTTVLKNS